ncbi:MAG: peptidylprolyl isomerase [Kofleriaceae bacterium]|nr:peptidylprolyl isomerase [Myxococcales bacterium]MCB9560945.1 peptidylprolyl isomerase [Kofleriaceae bacterium]MCB9574917.1 peptidylprolyl isomerase [Kofleriaceae bacterium]
MRNAVLFVALSACSLSLVACEKANDSSSTGSGSASATGGGGSAGKGGAGASTARGPAKGGAPQVAKPVSEVRPPVAEDLAEYTKDLPGDGPLVATFDTSMGAIHCELAADKVPRTVANFVGLATGKKPWYNPRTRKVEKGVPFFDGLMFHRVIPEFMIQGGDPMGSGMGGPGYNFDDEFSPDLKHDRPGTLSMANAGVHGGHGTNGSQFFITEVPTDQLDGRHSVFGYCKEVDLVKAIARVPRDGNDRPNTPVTMNHVTITRGMPK